MDIDIQKEEERLLIKASINGDKDAFEKLFIRYEGMIKQQLINYTFNEFDSNDLLQETFIKTFLNLKKYNDKYSFAQWVRAIAKNTFIDYARRKGVKSTTLLMDNIIDISYNNETPENLIILRERSEDMEREIESLSVNYRKIIELRYYMGYSYEEIAQELSLPIGTVKTRLFRAKEILNKILQKYR